MASAAANMTSSTSILFSSIPFAITPGGRSCKQILKLIQKNNIFISSVLSSLLSFFSFVLPGGLLSFANNFGGLLLLGVASNLGTSLADVKSNVSV